MVESSLGKRCGQRDSLHISRDASGVLCTLELKGINRDGTKCSAERRHVIGFSSPGNTQRLDELNSAHLIGDHATARGRMNRYNDHISIMFRKVQIRCQCTAQYLFAASLNSSQWVAETGLPKDLVKQLPLHPTMDQTHKLSCSSAVN